MTASFVIEKLGLEPLEPEGGFFLQTYKSVAVLRQPVDAMTAIYYLLTRENFSAFHRLKSDEIYHFYLGSSVELTTIMPGGRLVAMRLGVDLAKGDRPQATVPAGTWQAARIADGDGLDWALIGTTVSPGFDFADFELGSKTELIAAYPGCRAAIMRLAREP